MSAKIRLMPLVLILVCTVARQPAAMDEFGSETLNGAGSTLAFPLVEAWMNSYQERGEHGVKGVINDPLNAPDGKQKLAYEAIGSSAGIQRLKSGRTDFALSEIPLSDASLQQMNMVQIPVALGAVGVVTNLPEMNKQPVRLDGPTLAAIFSGKITRWNDPGITQLNPDIKLPDASIKPVYRKDGSGTTYVFTQYLSQVSKAWAKNQGKGDKIVWPTGTGVKGTRGVIQTVKAQPYTLGYASYTDAHKAGLGLALLKNPSGQFVLPGPSTIQAATAGASQNNFLNSTQSNAYPVVASIYGLTTNNKKGRRAYEFLKWSKMLGQEDTRSLGYFPVPARAR